MGLQCAAYFYRSTDKHPAPRSNDGPLPPHPPPAVSLSFLRSIRLKPDQPQSQVLSARGALPDPLWLLIQPLKSPVEPVIVGGKWNKALLLRGALISASITVP